LSYRPDGAGEKNTATPSEARLAARRAEDWYDGLVQLCADPERAAAMGRAGRRVAVERYSAAETAKLLAAIFTEVSRQ